MGTDLAGRAATNREAHLRVTLYLGDHKVGPGKIQLLESIERCGSISAAARDMGMEDIATLEPGSRTSLGVSRTKKSTSPKADKSNRLKFVLPTLPHAAATNVRKANVLSGNSSAEVVVQADQGKNLFDTNKPLNAFNFLTVEL